MFEWKWGLLGAAIGGVYLLLVFLFLQVAHAGTIGPAVSQGSTPWIVTTCGPRTAHACPTPAPSPAPSPATQTTPAKPSTPWWQRLCHCR